MRISSREMAGIPAADEWSDAAVSTLLDCYSDKYLELNGGSIGSKGWKDVIFKLNSACAQGRPVYSYRRCKNKLDVMKRRFKLERDRKATNGGVSDWPWFEKMEEIVCRNPRTSSTATPALVSIPPQQQQQLQLGALHAPDRGLARNQASGVEASGGVVNLRERVPTPASQACVLESTLALHEQDISASQLLSDPQDEEEDEDDQQQAKRAAATPKKRKKSGSGGGGLSSSCGGNSLRHAKEIARIVTEALERMEMKRLEVMRELELKRNETQLQIARMMIEFNSRAQQQNNLHNRQPSSSSDPHSFVEQEQ